MNSPLGWKRLFEDPVTLPNGRKLVTLLDAGNYIAGLPRKEHESDPWQAAIEALLMAVCSASSDGSSEPACRARSTRATPGRRRLKPSSWRPKIAGRCYMPAWGCCEP